METQCPNCKNVFNLPPEYKDREVECRKCGISFNPEKFKRAPIVVPSALPSAGNFITKLWTKSPVAFRAGFLGTLGVIAALWLAWHIMGIGARFQRSAIPKTTSSISQVFLYDYDFEQKIDFNRPNNLPCCKVIWHAWVYNPHPYWVNGYYFIEFRDLNGALLKTLQVDATFPNTSEPREATGLYWMPDNMFRYVDFAKSRIYIEIKK